jgi:hypothetical protein
MYPLRAWNQPILDYCFNAVRIVRVTVEKPALDALYDYAAHVGCSFGIRGGVSETDDAMVHEHGVPGVEFFLWLEETGIVAVRRDTQVSRRFDIVETNVMSQEQ